MSRAAIIGGGVIGAGWAARFLLNGWDVAVFDPDPQASRKVGEVLDNARASLPALYRCPMPAEGRLSFAGSLAEAVTGAQWVQESVSERLDLKHRVYREIGAHLDRDAVLASSTSGFKPSDLGAGGVPVVVVHPFNPVYLLPLAEICGPPDLCDKALSVVASLGMHPLVLRAEIDAFIANRFLEAVWREALWMIRDDIATTAEIDDAIRMGFGLRWAQMGLFETYRIAGGEAGMASFIEQFGPALAWPWTRLMDVPELDDALIAKISAQSDAQSGALTIRQLERLRDDNLVGILRSLRRNESGAGASIAAHEARLIARSSDRQADGALPVTARCSVPVTWTDYNGHMNEAAYLVLASEATDGFMQMIGADAAYVAGGNSFFTVDTRLRYLAEVLRAETLTVTTQVIAGAGKTMHLLHRIAKADGTLAATVETLLLHTDLATRRACAPAPAVADALARIAQAHAGLEAPSVGGCVGSRQ